MKNLFIFALIIFFTSCKVQSIQEAQQIEIITEDENTTPPPINTPFTAVYVTNDCKTVRDTAVTFIFTAADSLQITEDYGEKMLIWTDKTGHIEVVTQNSTIESVTVYPSVDEDLYYETYFSSSKMKRNYETNPQIRH